jgi:hypothetical protein
VQQFVQQPRGAAGFKVLLTTDKNIQYQQNLAGRKISVLVLANSQWPVVRLHLGSIATALNAAKPGGYTEVEIPSDKSSRWAAANELYRRATGISNMCRE